MNSIYRYSFKPSYMLKPSMVSCDGNQTIVDLEKVPELPNK